MIRIERLDRWAEYMWVNRLGDKRVHYGLYYTLEFTAILSRPGGRCSLRNQLDVNVSEMRLAKLMEEEAKCLTAISC